MALQTEKSGFAAHQHEAGHSAVRIVALHAPQNPHRRMLKNEGASLFDMATDAGFPVGLSERNKIVSAVRIVAVRALNQTFRHTMVKRQRELSLDGGVAAVAQSRL